MKVLKKYLGDSRQQSTYIYPSCRDRPGTFFPPGLGMGALTGAGEEAAIDDVHITTPARYLTTAGAGKTAYWRLLNEVLTFQESRIYIIKKRIIDVSVVMQSAWIIIIEVFMIRWSARSPKSLVSAGENPTKRPWF